MENDNNKINVALLLDSIRNYDIDNTNIIPNGISIPDFNLTLLNKRLYDARKAFLLLCENNMNSDSELIAGHILETCAIIYYIKSAADKLLNSRKYIAKSSASTVYDILSLEAAATEDGKYNAFFKDLLDYLNHTGHLIVKETKSEDKHKFNQHLLSQLKNNDKNNNEKRKLIKKHYELPIVNDYLNHFIAGMRAKALHNDYPAAQYDEALRLFYMSYCRLKHATPFLYPSKEADTTITITDNPQEIIVPAVFMCMDMIVDKPVYFK